MRESADERIAAALEAGRDRIAEAARSDMDDAVRALAQAFGHGRWGTFWCRFRDPVSTLHRLAELGADCAHELLQMPGADRLVGRFIQAVGEVAVVVIAQERTTRDQEAGKLYALLKDREESLQTTVHELRRPLALASGHLSMIQDGTFGEAPPEMRHALEQVADAHNEMETLLNDLAGVLRLEAGVEELDVRPLRLGEVISNAVQAMTAEAARKGGTRIEVEIEDPELGFPGDGKRLRIAIVNLIGNAIKYGPEGSVVTVRGIRRSMGVEIAVSDEGSGIDPADRGRIFEAHRRGRNPGATEGLGLGLAIVRRIAEMHGGHVTVDSPPRHGATFTLHLPMRASGGRDVDFAS